MFQFRRVPLSRPSSPASNGEIVAKETASDLPSDLDLNPTHSPLFQPAPPIKTLPVAMSSPKVAIIISSIYGHVPKMAEAAKQDIEKAGGQASIFQVADSETLPPEILEKMHTPPKPDYPIFNPNDLTNDDLFGVPSPTRNRSDKMPAQWKTLKSTSAKVQRILKVGKMLSKTFSCFFVLLQMLHMIMESKISMKKSSHLLVKLLQLLVG
ncbi:hypothetical protein M378DRAFT_913112 [Amanita muscaria Koide BX008]|uniref:Flavodoxin-like domain-containing protein n=1 Tax=Amanita muscaria (strain Koide BX008) TaxID=946122 RepID=A0A0C2SCL6_AMAMK|nr:hypothetical protein M378DRAFT_913112 [Amanita muscaria Koide BX008]